MIEKDRGTRHLPVFIFSKVLNMSLAELTEQLREHRDSSEQAARDTAERAARWDAAA